MCDSEGRDDACYERSRLGPSAAVNHRGGCGRETARPVPLYRQFTTSRPVGPHIRRGSTEWLSPMAVSLYDVVLYARPLARILFMGPLQSHPPLPKESSRFECNYFLHLSWFPYFDIHLYISIGRNEQFLTGQIITVTATDRGSFLARRQIPSWSRGQRIPFQATSAISSVIKRYNEAPWSTHTIHPQWDFAKRKRTVLQIFIC